MTFALSGDTITQLGADSDATTISGLQAIAGVTSIAESGRTRLVIPYKLSISGVMTNTSAVAFTFSRAGSPTNEVVINTGGRWNYKESRTVNGLTDWRIMPPIIFTQTVNNGYNGTTNNLIYLNGGIIDHAKVEHQGNGGQYYNGGQVIYRDVIINAEGLALVNDNQITTQAGTPLIDIIGLEMRGASMFFKGANIVNLKAYKPKFVTRGYGGGFGEQVTLQDLDSNGATFDLAIYSGGQSSAIRSNNGVKGGGVTCGPWSAPSNTNNEYYCTSDLLLTGINEIGGAVQFKAYHLDNNTGAPAGAGVTATNYTLRKTYNVLSSAGGVATLNLLIGAGLNDAAMVRRSATQTDDLYAFKCFSYLSNPTTSTAINLAGAGVKSATVVQLKDPSITQLVKATVDAYTTIDNLDQFYDRAKSYLFDNFAGETATLLVASGTALDAGSKNITIDSAAVLPFAFNSGTNTLTIKTAAFSAGSKFKSLVTTGAVTLATATAVSNIAITGTVAQATPANLSSVTITGTLTYSTATATPVTFTNVTAGTVSNSGAGAITIKRINSTLTAGTNVTSYVPTVLVFTLGGGRIRVLNNVGVEQYNQTTDGTFELPAAATGTWTYAIRKYGQQAITGSVAIDGTTKAITASYIPDTQIVDTETNVTAYTALDSGQQIYDYLSLYGATAAGIVFGVVASKGFGTLTVPAGLTLNPAAAAIVAIVAGVVTSRTNGLSEAITLLSSGSIVQGTATLSASVAVRAANLDSELVYTADAITFYPTAGDRNAGTNAGASVTGGLYRFKLGATVSGVLLSGTVALRVTVGGITFFADVALTAGRNVLDLGVQSQLAALTAKTLDTQGVRVAVWDAVKANHTIVGSTGAALGTGGGGSAGATLAEIEGSTVIAKQATAAQTLAAVQALPSAPTSAANATAVMNSIVEGTMTLAQAQRVQLAALSGKTTGVGTSTETYLSQDGTAPRVVATFDVAGNRTAVTVTP